MDFNEAEQNLFNSTSPQLFENDTEVENSTITAITEKFLTNNISYTTSSFLNSNQDIFNLEMLSWELNNMSLPCLIVSPIIIVISILASRYFLTVVSNNVIIGTFRSCFLDFITAGEATLISWELLSLFHQYGIWVWGLGAWLTITVKTYRYRADTSACPYTHLLNLLAGLTDLRTAAARIAAQFTGGLVSYR